MVTFDDDKQNKKVDELRREEEEELVRMLAEEKYGLPYANLMTASIDNEALRYIDEDVARAQKIAPFKILGKNIDIAIHTPENPELEHVRADLERKGLHANFSMASMQSLEKAWARYAEISHATVSRVGGLDISGSDLKKLSDELHTTADVASTVAETLKENKTHTVSMVYEIILAGAIGINASDIHFEPEEDHVRMRYRLDGVLQDILSIDQKTYKLLHSRIKLISGMKLTSDNIAQDGRFSIFLGDEEISVRVSAIPGAYGESIVLRILNPKSIQVELESMGIDPKLFEVINREIKKPNGMILLTGPTGSGKTTTLYAFIRRIYSPEIKIITIEDPIEYHLAGITQTQTDNEHGYTFIEGLRSALRQDPDVIMVGEIRDSETAKIAVESALTGHMVFSTLHTNNAAGVIPRLIDLEVNPKILVSALTLSIAQRLVRKLCPDCKKELEVPEKDKTLMAGIIAHAIDVGKDLSRYNLTKETPIKLWGPIGCDKCNKTGYKGRIGVFEAILTDEAIGKIMPSNPSEREIEKVAETQGILNMREDGVVKILSGVTSLEEVRSVVEMEEN